MNLGFRISDNSYFQQFNLELVQISVWHLRDEDVNRIGKLAKEVRAVGKRFVIHPFGLYLSETRTEFRKHYLEMLKRYARIADLGMIVHDETVPGLGPLQGEWSHAYSEAVAEIEKICPVSIENGNDSPGIVSFWKSHARSLVFDIGHFEVAGVDCHAVMDTMAAEGLIVKLDYIHLHRVGEMRPGTRACDHWPLVEGCPELGILKRLLELKPDAKVILEVDGEENLRSSLEVL